MSRTINAEELRSLQAPVKERYREDPGTASITLRAEGRLGDGLTCSVDTGKALVEAGLHPATGGDGLSACSGDMLLQALVACAGVTMSAVATALGIHLRDATVRAEGDLDFRGTLGVSKEVPVGFQRIRLQFDLDTDAAEEQLATLLRLTERYCVVYQTLNSRPEISVLHRTISQ
jgi:uncharacterized OsmC-like protein